MRRLASDGVTDRANVERALREKGLAVPSRMTITRWLGGKTSPLTCVRPFDPTSSDDLGFFVGAWLGDGWGDTNDGGKRMLLKVRSRDFAEEFAKSASIILQKVRPYSERRVVDRNGEWHLVKVTSLKLFDFVNQPIKLVLELLPKSPKASSEASSQQRAVPQ